MARLDDSETRFKNIDAEFETARETAKAAKDRFTALKKKRCDLFNKAYSHISDRIDVVYKDLTKGKSAPMGGIAYLSLEDSEVSSQCVRGAASTDDGCRNRIYTESNITRCRR